MSIADRFQTKRNRSRTRRRGVMLVEFSIVASVMFVIIFTCAEVGRVALLRSLAEDATFEAARMGIIPGITTAEITTEAKKTLNVLGAKSVTVNVRAYENGVYKPGGITDDTEEIEVEVTLPIDANSYFIGSFSPTAKITAKTRMETERYRGYFDGG